SPVVPEPVRSSSSASYPLLYRHDGEVSSPGTRKAPGEIRGPSGRSQLAGADRADSRFDAVFVSENPAALTARPVQCSELLGLVHRHPVLRAELTDHAGRVLEGRALARGARNQPLGVLPAGPVNRVLDLEDHAI